MLPRFIAADAIRARLQRLFRRPSSAVWLRRVRLKTAMFDDTLEFYTNTLGIARDKVTAEPTSGRPLAHFLDASGEEILLIEESNAEGEPSDLEITFVMPRRAWYLLRSRLDTQRHEYEGTEDAICLKDPNGITIHVNALDEQSSQTPDDA